MFERGFFFFQAAVSRLLAPPGVNFLPLPCAPPASVALLPALLTSPLQTGELVCWKQYAQVFRYGSESAHG